MKTFVLAPEDGARIAYDPGQFMTFRAEVAGETVERCYTLSSSAAAERAVEITVKKREGGRLSGHLHEALTVGGRIDTFGPAGEFGPVGVPADKYLLLSAGSGVTPMLSIVRTAADLGIDLDAAFVQVAHHPRDMIGSADLLPLARRLPRLRISPVASVAPRRWRGTVGRLDGALLARLVPDLAERAVLCCGPQGFMTAMRAACASVGVRPDRYMEESFDFGEIEAGVATGAGPTRRILFQKSGRSFDCPDGFTILQAARAAGVPMPSSCARGICGTCKSFMLSGDVAMDHGGGIREREIARGFVLPCSSMPRTDVILDR